MRLYSFVNFYLSPIQHGIQTAHCIGELVPKYISDPTPDRLSQIKNQYVIDWAQNHKTIVCLNGGNQADLLDLVKFFDQHYNQYPWSCFREDHDSLNSCLTCTAIILPASIYEAAKFLRDNRSGYIHKRSETEYGLWIPPQFLNEEETPMLDNVYSQWDTILIEKLKYARLA